MNTVEFDDNILIIESDLFFEPSVLGKIIHSKYANVALVDKFKTGMDGTVVTVNNRIITNIIPIQLQDQNFDFSDKYKTLNIYKFSKEFCEKSFKKLLHYYAQTIDDNCYYEMILGILIYLQKEVINAEFIDDELWAEVDDPNDLNVAEFIFADKSKLGILDNAYGGFWNYGISDFAFIRNVYFPNSSMISEMKHNFSTLLQNYCSRQDILNQKLSFFLLCDKTQVHLLNGASQIFPLFGQLFKNKRVLLPDPTFGEYPRIFPHADTYSDKVGIDSSEIELKKEHHDIIIFVNPNNPTGTYVENEYIHHFAQENPEKTVIVDESFIDFSEKISVLSLLQNQPLDNVIIIKSLSKTLGVPGLRLGFVFSSDAEFNQNVKDFLPIWNSNSIAEFFLEILLKHRGSLEESYQRTVLDRKAFFRHCSELSYIKKVHTSAANFLLLEFEKSAKNRDLPLWLMEHHSIYIRNVSDKFDNGNYFFRIAVRLPEENMRLIHCMNRYYHQ
jgi:histidinol-phosphate/aromatic aminotransferase/cobyric acid decarboxylase-like protein